MKYDDDYSSGHINLFAPQHDSTHKQPKSILKHTNYRTKNPPQSKDDTLNKNFDDLNIRGYASNIYRDDFNALKIESKDNLIPWNGDQNLLIDKYDCRLYLHDLSPYDGELLSESARNPQLSHEENETENLCEFERYLDLNEDDENLNESDQFDSNYHERGAAIGFTYDTNETKVKQINEQEEENKNLKIFVPDENLKLPIGMAYPETVKLNQLIVKTASFVAKQGLQAEILLKTKQSTNSQFNFLNYGDQLHAYYKHLINLIRNNSINPFFYLQQEIENPPPNSTQEVEKKVSNSENESSENDEDDDEDNYLHPLLSKALNRSVSEASFSQIQDTNLSHLKNEQINIEESLIEEKQQQQQDGKDVKENVENMIVENELVIEEPSGNEKIVIDKLAEYVSRNGVEFEENLRKKNDLRFEFLNKEHKFYNYYQLQVKNMTKKREEENKKEDVEEIKDKKESRSKRSHKSSHKKSRKKSTEKSNSSESSRSSSSSSSSSSNNEHTDSENEKNNDNKRKVKRKHKHKSHKSRHEKSSSSSSRRSHRDSRKKHRKRSRSRS
ncbi:unnamed protein product [Brachionus calyciflorus]|uniref:SURP motif domain-containing protein n=1 Tax=Brachionus calyciflorus TaxID=104777 RepID=A0A813MCP4_9BILA|nr:unnamed protein product [Brachionus calyciflorus]